VASDGAAQDAGIITVQITDARQGIRGRVGTINRQFVLRLQGNRVQEVGSVSGRRGTRTFTTESAFREQNVRRRASLMWRVGAGNSIVRRADHPHHVETITISVAGSSCRVAVRNDLKPGYSTYLFVGGRGGGGGRGMGMGGGRGGPRAGIGGYPGGGGFGGRGGGSREFSAI
jgi:hypothetical protein